MAERAIDWPRKTREVHNHHLDSTQWNRIEFRGGDIIVANWAKSGTTWVQQIVAQLIYGGSPDIEIVSLASWPEWRGTGAQTAAQQAADHTEKRRLFKTHIPADALPISPFAKYIYVGRDARDVVWSLYAHHANYSAALYDHVNNHPGRIGPALDPPNPDIRQYYREWLDKDGFPFWPFWAHVRSWWDIRALPCLLFVHYENLKRDTENEVRRIAGFLQIPVERDLMSKVLAHSSFDFMKANYPKLVSPNAFADGAASFINKGVNGRWRDVLTPAEIDKADEIAARELAPQCAHWLRTGELPV